MKQFLDKILSTYQLVKVRWGIMTLFYLSAISEYVIDTYLPFAIAKIIGYATNLNSQMAFRYVIYLAIGFILRQLVCYANYRLYSYTQIYFSIDLYQQLFQKLLTVDLSFSKYFSKSRILSTVKIDVESSALLIDASNTMFSTAVSMIIMLTCLFNIDIITTLLIVLSILLYLRVVQEASLKMTNYLEQERKQDDKINQILLDELKGLKEVKTLPVQKGLERKLNTQLRRYSKLFFKKCKYNTRVENTSELIPNLTKFFLYFFLILFLGYRGLAIEILVLVLQYYDNLIYSAIDFLDAYKRINELSVSIYRVKDLLEYKNIQVPTIGTYVSDQVFGAIHFDQVSLAINSQFILKNISFEVKPYTMVAIVGKSGSGKSLLFSLLLRNFTPTTGTIYLDGKEISEYEAEVYASNLSYVKQNPFFFHMSIKNNLRLVNSNFRAQRETCKLVGIDEFIMSNKKGYNFVLKENASNISGGQKQLLSIARALLTDAEVLLFDDLTSSLDPKTGSQITNLLKELKNDHTLLVITNRENIMKESDQIIYLKDGEAYSFSDYHQYQKEVVEGKEDLT